MDMKTLLYRDGVLLPARIELQESSGPVAPKYQYDTRIVITVIDGAPSLRYEDEGEYLGGAPARHTAISVALPVESYERLWGDLAALDALHRGDDLIGEEKRRRVGVSFNFVSLQLGEQKARIDYLRTLLDGDSPEQAPARAIIALIKTFASAKVT